MKSGKTHVITLLDELGIRPSKKLGQNFLVDPNLIDKMVRTAEVGPNDHIIEIGAGLGDVTCALLNRGAYVTAVEFDKRLCAYLRNVFEHQTRFQLIEGDAARISYDQIVGEDRWCSVSSLPYSAGAPILGRFLEQRNPPEHLVLLLQKETGQRLAAPPGTKEYGSLSVRVQHTYHVAIERYAPPDVFYPVPKVSSALVRLQAKPSGPDLNERLRLKEICRIAFSQRRKKLVSLLAAVYGSNLAHQAFYQLGLNTQVRAEQLSVDTMKKLTDVFAVSGAFEA